MIGTDEAAALLYREALLLDRGDWDEWLQLFTDDAVFWMPAWRDELTPTADPDRELSLIYYAAARCSRIGCGAPAQGCRSRRCRVRAWCTP